MNLEVCSPVEEDPGELDIDAMLEELDQERHTHCGSRRNSFKCRTPRKEKRPVVYQPHTTWMCFPVSSNARGPRFNKTCFHSDGRGGIFPPFGKAARPAKDEDDPNELRTAVLVDAARVAWNCISARVGRRAFAKGEVLQMSVTQPADGGEATFQAGCSCNETASITIRMDCQKWKCDKTRHANPMRNLSRHWNTTCSFRQSSGSKQTGNAVPKELFQDSKPRLKETVFEVAAGGYPQGFISANGDIAHAASTTLQWTEPLSLAMTHNHGSDFTFDWTSLSATCRQCGLGKAGQGTIKFQSYSAKDIETRLEAHCESKYHRTCRQVCKGQRSLLEMCWYNKGVDVIAAKLKHDPNALCRGYHHAAVVYDGMATDITPMHGETARDGSWTSNAGSKTTVLDAAGNARGYVGSVHSSNCELFSVDWVTGKPDGQHCCTNCRRVVHSTSFKCRLKTVLKKGAIDGFGKTRHGYLTQEQLRYVLKQTQEKSRVALRAQATRSKVRRRKDTELRLENILHGDAKRMVNDLRALHTSGRLDEKAAWFELPSALLHSSKLKEVNAGGVKRSSNMRWPKRVKQIFGLLRKMGGKRAVTLVAKAANGPTLRCFLPSLLPAFLPTK